MPIFPCVFRCFSVKYVEKVGSFAHELSIDFFAENQRIETECLILRPVTLADAEDMYEYASDEETVRYVFF